MTWTNGVTRCSVAAWKTLAKHVMIRDHRTCYLCGGPATDVDHKVPYAEGGTDDPDNLGAICQPCHKAKTQTEATRGRARNSKRRPPPRHPGLS